MYLIFDFDGTLVDSFDNILAQFNRIAKDFNLRTINTDELNYLRDLNSIEIIKYLEIPLFKIPQLIIAVRKYLYHEIKKLPPITGLPEVLETLNKEGHLLGILTSNSADNVIAWLNQNKLEHLFQFIYIESKFFTKKHLLKKIIRAKKIDKTAAFYIGDETRDIEAAKQNEMLSIAVTWGFNSEKALRRCEPHFLANVPTDLLKIILNKKSYD